MRSEDHAYQQIREAGGDMQALKRDHDGYRNAQKQEDLFEVLHHTEGSCHGVIARAVSRSTQTCAALCGCQCLVAVGSVVVMSLCFIKWA